MFNRDQFIKIDVSKYKAVILDLDGTLYSLRNLALHLVLAYIPDALLCLNEHLTRKDMRGCDFGSADSYLDHFFDRMAERTGRENSFLRKWFFDVYMPNMCGSLKKYYKPRHGALDFIKRLNANSIKLAIYSDYPNVKEKTAAIGIDTDLCGKFFCPLDFGAQKPALRPFLEIAAALETQCSDILVVGDKASTDGEGAKAAGMDFHFIDRRYD
ncbi:MAG: HAD family hydrolase [Termitinemataceae bacterium]|nr:MAG: HAD family hydrolase [Termitinemataceae bacterium]